MKERGIVNGSVEYIALCEFQVEEPISGQVLTAVVAERSLDRVTRIQRLSIH